MHGKIIHYVIGGIPSFESNPPTVDAGSPRFSRRPLGGCGGCLGRLSQQASAANGSNDTPRGIIVLKLSYKLTD
jgi:hypothetical protein